VTGESEVMKVSHQEAPVSGYNPHREGGAGEGLECDITY
jgi:hypothetical protein